jgi:hypothetical protein
MTTNIANLDRLSGFSIESAQVLIPKAVDSSNLQGEAILPNHSVFTFALVGSALEFHSLSHD